MDDVPTSISEMAMRMDELCIRRDCFEIAGSSTGEGYGIDSKDGRFHWFYTERGGRDVIKSVEAEPEIVAYAWPEISVDATARMHCVGFLADCLELVALKLELRARGLAFIEDCILYGGPDDLRFQVYVVGTDIRKARDLQDLYGLPQ